MAANLDHIRHSLAHLLATAALEHDPHARLSIGPVIDTGFYYDIEFDAPFSDADLPKLEARMRELVAESLPFERIDATYAQAREQFKGNPYKLELIDELEKAGEKLTLYQTGTFIDLCRGGHVANTKDIPAEGFKLTHIAGAYWRGSEKNKMLTRIYGLAFETKEALAEQVARQEEAKKRDHRVLSEQLDLFMISDEVGKGLPLWLPNGAYIRKKLEDYMYEKEINAGYKHVVTPILTHKRLYERSGHLAHYRDDMYSPIEIEGEEYFLRPMNCPHHHQIYRHRMLSYRDLPLRLAEFGLVHRFERSGVLTGLIRARCFTQNDSHIYCTKGELKTEMLQVLGLFKDVYEQFGIKDYWFRLSLPDFSNKEKYGDIEDRGMWDEASRITRESLEEFGGKYVEGGGEAAFYGPKIDVQIRNVAGKEDTIATVQVDFYSPKRFDLVFTNEKGEKEHPVIIHRAIMGSFERFFAFLTEHYAGSFPLWLSPLQVKILPIGDAHAEFAKKVSGGLRASGVRAEVDESNETLGKKIRAAKLEKIPYTLVIGDKEVAAGGATLESRDKGSLGLMPLDEIVSKLTGEIASKA